MTSSRRINCAEFKAVSSSSLDCDVNSDAAARDFVIEVVNYIPLDLNTCRKTFEKDFN